MKKTINFLLTVSFLLLVAFVTLPELARGQPIEDLTYDYQIENLDNDVLILDHNSSTFTYDVALGSGFHWQANLSTGESSGYLLLGESDKVNNIVITTPKWKAQANRPSIYISDQLIYPYFESCSQNQAVLYSVF